MKITKKSKTKSGISRFKYKGPSVLATAIVVACGAPSYVCAQEGSNDEAKFEQIVVTGSHIRRDSSFEQKSPVQIVSAEDFNLTGASQVQDIIKTLSVNSGSEPVSEFTSLAGTVQFNIRGLGFGSTLSLVNGRRAGIAPVSNASGNDFLDVNQFPVLALAQIDLLTDGASAIYGSQAVAGVANLVTRKNFEGFEIQTDFRDTVNTTGSISFAAGTSFDKGRFSIFGTYYKQDRADRTDFDYIVERVGGNGDITNSRFLSGTGAPGTYFRAIDDGNGGLTRTGAGVADPDCLAAGGIFRSGTGEPGEPCRYNFDDQTSVLREEERQQVFAQFDYDFSDSVTYINETSFSRNLSYRSAGGEFVSNSNATGGGFIIPGDHPFNFFVDNGADGITYAGPEAFLADSTLQAVDIICQCRIFGAEANGSNRKAFEEEFGRTTDVRNSLQNFRMMNGLEIYLPGDWQASLSHSYATAELITDGNMNFAIDSFVDVLNAGDFNLFGSRLATPDLVSPKDGVSTARNDQLTVQQFLGGRLTTSRTVENVSDLIVSGDLFETDMGTVSMAGGFQYRKLSTTEIPDSLEQFGEANLTAQSFYINDDQDVFAAFGEVAIPFFEFGQLQLALRYEDYGGSIGSTTDPKIGIELSPTEWLSLRGSYGTSFQAPTVRQTSESSSSATLQDPFVGPGTSDGCSTTDGGSFATTATVRGAPDLGNQTAESFNFGAVFQLVDNLSLSADFYQYDYTNLIAQTEGPQAILINDCLDDGIANDPRVIRDGSGQLAQVYSEFGNVGGVVTSGVDLAASYNYDAGNSGKFEFSGVATYINKFEIDADGDGSREIDAVGSRNFLNSFAPTPEIRGNAGVTWYNNNHSANVTVRYISSYDNDQSNNAKIDSFTTLDVQYSIVLPHLIGDGEVTLAIGANNLLDQAPPGLARNDADGNLITRATNPIGFQDRPGYDGAGGADLRGRILYLRAKASF
jgi:iron complex outermembrane receptor protein